VLAKLLPFARRAHRRVLLGSSLRGLIQGPSHEAYVSAEPDPAAPGPWVSGADEDARWAAGFEASPGEGSKAARAGDAVEARVIAPTGPFTRTERIRRSSDFQSVSQKGLRRAARCFVVLAAPCSLGEGRARLGLTVSRKVGNAVVRNRVKRRIREWFRCGGRSLAAGFDLVVIARRDAASLETGQTAAELDRLVGAAR